ncbi:hypothetical protein QJS10_CPA01g01424 [Acorus calamus]|uniref:Transcription elongation factor Eaf N-terminal domain-containing protein n=1 Tax=Acorus calamus TaxID=4465 RepID=A0AAV9FP51_ACOCL|nr:hypothetical protein QJS10_CPA01g01424 [Acorus calamus]
MANNNGDNDKEPSTAPKPDKWYDIRLGSSFKDQSSTKFCTLRYEFKPASIDKSQPGYFHKNKENRVTVEFHNNQPGKPKVTFNGSIEDYKDNDGVLFFDGETFRLERLHRAVKRLRLLREVGESTTGATSASTVAAGSLPVESSPSPLGKVAKPQPANKPVVHKVPVEVERIDIGESGSPGAKPTSRTTDHSLAPSNQPFVSSDPTDFQVEEEPLNILDDDDDDDGGIALKTLGFDINIPTALNDTDDDEIADVDVSDNGEGEKGPNAAEALRAQVNAVESGEGQTSSSSGSSGSGSGSGSGSSSSDSDSSDDDSASSGGEIDI